MWSASYTYTNNLGFRLFAVALLAVLAQPVLAQTDQRSDCPGLADGAQAELQTTCWFEHSENGASECSAGQRGNDLCAQQAANWCSDAIFNHARVTLACFMSYVRAGRLEEAVAMQRYLQERSERITTCREALEKISVKIGTQPTGAEILIDSRSYGAAPVEVALAGRWWNSEIKARFESADNVREKRVSRQELLAAFDRRTCGMGQLTLSEPRPIPEEAQPSLMVMGAAQVGAAHKEPNHRARLISVPGLVLTVFGGAGVITGGVLLVLAGVNASEVSNPGERTQLTQNIEDKYYSVKPMRIGGGVALGVGTALAAAGIVLLVRGSSEDSGSDHTSTTLNLSGQGLQWTTRF